MEKRFRPMSSQDCRCESDDSGEDFRDDIPAPPTPSPEHSIKDLRDDIPTPPSTPSPEHSVRDLKNDIPTPPSTPSPEHSVKDLRDDIPTPPSTPSPPEQLESTCPMPPGPLQVVVGCTCTFDDVCCTHPCHVPCQATSDNGDVSDTSLGNDEAGEAEPLGRHADDASSESTPSSPEPDSRSPMFTRAAAASSSSMNAKRTLTEAGACGL